MPEPRPPLTGPCKGELFEHHYDVRPATDLAGLAGVHLIPVEMQNRWACVACGDTGQYTDAHQRMWGHLCGATVTLDRLPPELLYDAVLLLPSDAPAKRLGAFMGRSVYRMPCISEVMVAIPAATPGTL